MLTNRAQCVRLCALFFILLYSSFTFAGSAKFEVCHIPPGNPDNYHTIKISEKALAKHLAHFDLVGSCNSLCDDICGDGNACTIDHDGNCEQNGCFALTEPVDCDDSNECTNDFCDEALGCYSMDADICEPPADNLCITSTCNPENAECLEAEPVCGDNEECNPSTGNCEAIAEESACPCFTEADLAASGGVAACDPTDGNTLIGLLENSNQACSGAGCDAPAPGCGFLDNNSGFYTEGPLTDDQNTACRALIIDRCP